MKRMTIVGLSLVAMFAFGAMAASSAFAGEYGTCLKTKKLTLKYEEEKIVKGKPVFTKKTKAIYNGKYTEAKCLTLAKDPGALDGEGPPKVENPEIEYEAGNSSPYTGPEGEYEWVPATECAEYESPYVPRVEFTASAPCPEKLTYTSKTGVATLTGATGVIECKKSTDSGAITSPFTDTDKVKFETCTTKGVKCTTAEYDEVTKEWKEHGTVGDIETFLLDTTLIDHGTPLPQYSNTEPPGDPSAPLVEPKEGEAWTLFESSEKAPYGEQGSPFFNIQAAYICKGVAELQTTGLLAGVTTPVNTMEATLTTTFEAGKGLQDLFSEADATSPAFGTGTPIGQGIEKAVGSTKGGEKEEVRTCNETGAVSEGKGAPACAPLPFEEPKVETANPLKFGAVEVGKTKVETIKIKNPVSVEYLFPANIYKKVGVTQPFTIVKESAECVNVTPWTPAGETCEIEVKFAPTAKEPYESVLKKGYEIAHETGKVGIVKVTLQGEGT